MCAHHYVACTHYWLPHSCKSCIHPRLQVGLYDRRAPLRYRQGQAASWNETSDATTGWPLPRHRLPTRRHRSPPIRPCYKVYGVLAPESAQLTMQLTDGAVPFWGSFIVSYRLGQAIVPPDGSNAAQVFAGAFAGVFSSVILTPVDAVKLTAQVQGCSSREALDQLWKVGSHAAAAAQLLLLICTTLLLLLTILPTDASSPSYPTCCSGVGCENSTAPSSQRSSGW